MSILLWYALEIDSIPKKKLDRIKHFKIKDLCTIIQIQYLMIRSFCSHISQRFTGKLKLPLKLSDEEIKEFKSRLLNSSWEIKDEFVSTLPAKQIYVTTQSLLDRSCPLFMESLNKNSDQTHTVNLNEMFPIGSGLPLAYSLGYCNPLSNESELGVDGYDNYHAPCDKKVEFFKRRMWVNGSFAYNHSNPLKFGDKLNFTETVKRVKVLKETGTIFAEYKRCFNNQNGSCIVEMRGLGYLADLYSSYKQRFSTIENPDKSITVVPTLLTNFRMSAVTFNSHQIHYNPEYAKSIENYPDIVIEAPLLISLASQFWLNYNTDIWVKSFKYKISAPSFVNKPLTISYKKLNGVTKLWITNQNSVVCFEATLQT